MQELLVSNASFLPSATKVLGRDAQEVERLRAALISFNRTGSVEEARLVRSETSALIHRQAELGISNLILASAGVSGGIPDPYSKVPPYLWTPAAVQLLQEELSSRHQLTFSASIRNEPDWLDSLHRHHLRTRGTRQTLDELRAGPIGSFRFSDLIERIVEFVPDLLVFRMEEDAASEIGIGRSLVTHLGVPETELTKWTPATQLNRGISSAAADVLSKPMLRLLPRFLRARLARFHS